MSRIGNKPITVPAEVTVKIDGQKVTVTGPKGTLEREIHKNISLEIADNTITVVRKNDEPQNRSLHGLTRTLINNMIIGVTETYSKELFVYGNKQGRGGEVLYDLLELKAPEVVQKEIINGEQYRSISLEAINEYAGDMIMIGGWQEDPMDLVGNNSVWNSTPAVKNQKVITYDSSAYIYQDILSTKEQLKNITQSILALYE